MNFKKFISGVSALTIAASAFAGMAVTASADASHGPYTVSAGYSSAGLDDYYAVDMNNITILKFDASSVLTAMQTSGDTNIASATLTIYEKSNSSNKGTTLRNYYLSDWDAANNSITTKNQLTANGEYIGEKATGDNTNITAVNIDVRSALKAELKGNGDGIFAIGFYTTTARQQYIEKNTATLSVATTTKADAGTVTIKYLDPDDNLIESPSNSLKGVLEGDEFSVYYPAYIVKNGTYYVCTEDSYKKTSNFTSGNTDVEVRYSPVTDKEIVFFREAESFTSQSGQATSDPSDALSNGYAVSKAGTKNPVTITENVTISNDGEYTFSIPMRNMNGNTRNTFVTITDITDAENPVIKVNGETYSLTGNGTMGTYSKTMDLTAGTYEVKLYNEQASTGAWANPDYLLVYRPKYEVNKAATLNGTFEVSSEKALSGATVTITPSAASGYEVDSITVTNLSDNSDVTVTNNSFIMPKANVSVAVTFKSSSVAGDITSSFANGVTVTGTNIIDGASFNINHKWEGSSEGYVDPVSADIEPINIANKTIHFEFLDSGNANSGGIITFKGIGINIQKSRGNDYDRFYADSYSNAKVDIYERSTAKTIDIMIPQTNKNAGANIYVDGKRVGYVNVGYDVDIRKITGITVDQTDGTFTAKINNLKVIDNPATADLTVDGVTTSYIVGTEVTLPTPAEGKVWSVDGENAVESNTITVPAGGATYAQIDEPVAGPSAKVTEVSYNKYPAASTAANDADLTAAKILVTVTGFIDTLGLKYYDAETATWTDAKYTQNFTGLTDTTIVLGAIVPGLVELSTSSFDAVIE